MHSSCAAQTRALHALSLIWLAGVNTLLLLRCSIYRDTVVIISYFIAAC